MGKIIAYILAVMFALCAILILGLFVAVDIVRTKEYLHADRTIARIRGYVGVKNTANYGLWQAPTKYHGYEVAFTVGGKSCSGIHLSKDRLFKEGDSVEIRYVVSKKGEVEIVNRDIKDRFFRMLICAVIAVPFCIIFLLQK